MVDRWHASRPTTWRKRSQLAHLGDASERHHAGRAERHHEIAWSAKLVDRVRAGTCRVPIQLHPSHHVRRPVGRSRADRLRTILSACPAFHAAIPANRTFQPSQMPVPVPFLLEGLRPSNSPTGALARRFAASLRSRGSLAALARVVLRVASLRSPTASA